MVRKILLICGILAALLYIGMDIIAAIRWESYSYTDQTVSELFAIGAPTRPLVVTLMLIYSFLIIAFGWGVRGAARGKRALCVVGGLLIGRELLGIMGTLFFPIHLREALTAGEGTLTDTMHGILTMVGALFYLLAMGFGATAFGKWFRLYSIGTILVLVIFGIWAGLDQPQLVANLPTLWIGGWERIHSVATMLWIAVLAIVLLHIQGAVAQIGSPLQRCSMSKCFRSVSVFLVLALVIGGCVARAPHGEPPPASSEQGAISAAVPLPAGASAFTNTTAPRPEASPNLLPHRLYFLGKDQHWISQIYRMERDGRTVTQLTFEAGNVSDYDVSRADGRLAYAVNNQLVLVNAADSTRRVLVEAPPNPEIQAVYRPAFSPDGQTLAYGHNGLTLYALATGVSHLVLENQYGEPLPSGALFPIEVYWPAAYAPDGKKLLIALGHWEVAPSHAVYYPDTHAIVRYAEVKDYIYCCSFHGGPVWAPDSAHFYGVASVHDTAYQAGELWQVDAKNGALTRTLLKTDEGMINLPKELYLAPDGKLYFFWGTYAVDSGFFDAPMLKLVRAAPDGVTDRTVLRDENFVLMKEALWAPDASFVIVSMAPARDWSREQEGGVLELYYTDRAKTRVWLAPLGYQMKWGP